MGALDLRITVGSSQSASTNGASEAVQLFDADLEGGASRSCGSLRGLPIESLRELRIVCELVPDGLHLSVDFGLLQIFGVLQLAHVAFGDLIETMGGTDTALRTTQHLMNEDVDRTKVIEYRVDLLRRDPGKAEVGSVQVVCGLGDAPADVNGLRQEAHILPRLALIVCTPDHLREASVVVLV